MYLSVKLLKQLIGTKEKKLYIDYHTKYCGPTKKL